MSKIEIVKLLPEQVADKWYVIRPMIEMSLPPLTVEAADRMSKILEAILCGDLECIVFVGRDNKMFYVLMTVATVISIGSLHSDLMIYSIYGTKEGLTPGDWKDGLNKLRLYATGKGCSRIIAFSNVPEIIILVKSFGGNVDYRLLTIDI